MNIPKRWRNNRGSLVVLYDGECVLCNTSVDCLLKLDTEKIFLFAPLQGETGRKVLQRHDRDPAVLDSMAYVRGFGTENETLYRKSTGVLMALADLGGFWRAVSWLRFVPRFIRDPVYDFVAKYRYRWFGQYNECRIPDSVDRERFLE